jgi:hypothetical protein
MPLLRLFTTILTIAAIAAFLTGFQDWAIAFGILAGFLFFIGLLVDPVFSKIVGLTILVAGIAGVILMGFLIVAYSHYNPIGFAVAIVAGVVVFFFVVVVAGLFEAWSEVVKPTDSAISDR